MNCLSFCCSRSAQLPYSEAIGESTTRSLFIKLKSILVILNWFCSNVAANSLHIAQTVYCKLPDVFGTARSLGASSKTPTIMCVFQRFTSVSPEAGGALT